TNVEADHLDHYGDLAAIEAAFDRFLAAARSGRIVCADDPVAARLGRRHGAFTYGTAESADLRIVDVAVDRGETTFRLLDHGEEAARVRLPEPGLHNALNATAAIAAAHDLGVPVAEAAAALASYAGV